MLISTLVQLQTFELIDSVEIHSFDNAFYMARAIVDSTQYRLTEPDGSVYKRRSIEQIKKDLQACHIVSMTLVHQSAFDEMIGQPLRCAENIMRVALSLPR